jgi:FkbM family methyltransferase
MEVISMKQARFNYIEMSAIAAFAIVVGLTVGGLVTHRSLPPTESKVLQARAITNELAPIVRRFGPAKNSSHEEEFFIRDFFGDRRDGVFLDVGAGHYRKRSNTYFLEHNLGWSGIAVDAQAKFAKDYATYRPRTRFFTLFVSDVSDRRVRLYVGQNDLFSSSDRHFTEGYVPVTATEDITTITLNDLLKARKVKHLDFVSMDIELAEPKALAGFDIERFRPDLVCVEAHPEVRQQLLDYFHTRHYVIVGKYLRADPQNLWFAPDDAKLPVPERGLKYGESH